MQSHKKKVEIFFVTIDPKKLLLVNDDDLL